MTADRKVFASEPFAQWERLGLAEKAVDGPDVYFRWTPAGERYASYYERTMAYNVVAGAEVPPYVDLGRLEHFTRDGFAKVDEE